MKCENLKTDSRTRGPDSGLGPDSRFLRLEDNCVYTHLDIPDVVEKYKRCSRRVILLDYGSAYAPVLSLYIYFHTYICIYIYIYTHICIHVQIDR